MAKGAEVLFPSPRSRAWGTSYEHQQPRVIPILRSETHFPQMVRFLLDKKIESTCAVPLTTAHRRLGTLGFGSGQPDAYSDVEVRLLRSVSDVVALAIDDALNFEASRRAQEELQREKDRIAAGLLESELSVMRSDHQPTGKLAPVTIGAFFHG